MGLEGKIIGVAALTAVVSLTGCSNRIGDLKVSINDHVGEFMLQKSGVTQEPGYTDYVKYRDEGKLDADGYYVDLEDVTTEELQGEIYVTFAKNKNLNTRYYTDESCSASSVIDSSVYYLNPGDQLYATYEKSPNVYTSEYDFSRFRIDEYDGENHIESTVLQMVKSGDKYVLSIPSDYTGTSISIIPLGEYSPKTITADANYIDDNGKNQKASGHWSVNGTEFSETIDISCTSAYTVSFQYDSNEYFFVSSEPQCFYSDNDEGIVEFKRYEANSTISDYSIELHKKLTISLPSDVERRVQVVGGGTWISVTPDKSFQLESKKYGDVVGLITDSKWEDLSSIKELRVMSEELLSDGTYKYTLKVRAKDGDFEFEPSDYQYEHGTINFYLNGNLITDTEYLAPDTVITFEQKSADEGYWLKGSNRSITVRDKKEDTIAALKAIEFVPQDPVIVRLPQPSAGGTITYIDPESKRPIATETTELSTYQGSEIDMTLRASSGWTSDVVEYTYIVTGGRTQTIKINDKNVDDVFVESEDHKPKLTITLARSVGDTMDFAVSASGWEEKGIKYDLNPFVNTRTNKIGTDKSIEIYAYHRTNQAGKVVRAEITRTDTNKNETRETMFLDDSHDAFDSIDIYESGTNAALETTYTAIDITISVIDAVRYSSVKPKDHTVITVNRKKTGEMLSDGDLVSPSEDVIVTIAPDPGYYITADKNITGDTYAEKKKYSKYLDEIDSILDDIEVHKYITVSLDKSDSYATYEYRLDRDTVSGQIRVKEGQKLELTYTITDETYELTEAQGGILFGLGSSTSEATKSIEITRGMDGTRITKEAFGIETKRKD